MVFKLIFTMLMPLLVGKLLQRWGKIRLWVSAHGKHLKLASSGFLCIIPWMKVSSSADEFKTVPASSFVLVLVAGIVVHLIYLCLNYSVAEWLLCLPLNEKKATVIITSQKTLPVAMTVLEFLPPTLGQKGLIAIPIIASHLMQIIIDAFVAAKWASVKDDHDEEVAAKPFKAENDEDAKTTAMAEC